MAFVTFLDHSMGWLLTDCHNRRRVTQFSFRYKWELVDYLTYGLVSQWIADEYLRLRHSNSKWFPQLLLAPDNPSIVVHKLDVCVDRLRISLWN